MNTTHLKQALQEAFGSNVFDDKMNDSVHKRVEQLGKAGQTGDDAYFTALRDTLGANYSHNVDRQVRDRLNVLTKAGGNPPPAPGLGGNTPPPDKVATPFNDPTVKGNASQESLTSGNLDTSGSVNADQKAAFEANPADATRGTGGNTPTGGGVNSRIGAATNSGNLGPPGPGAGNVGNQ